MFKNLSSKLIIGLITSLFFISNLYSAPISQNGTAGGMDGGIDFIIETVDIGIWNMDASTTISVNTGITALVSEVKILNVWVLQDDLSILYNLNTMQQTPQTVSGSISDISDLGDGTLVVTFDRLSSGFFDENADFNDAAINRGFVTIIRSK